MDQELIEVAQNGDIDAFYALLGRYPSILDENNFRFINTPLHWAVMAGHTSFAIEIANLMPSLTKKLNHDGYSALHLASANGHLEIVKELLQIDNNLSSLKGRERRTPLHSATINGHINVLKELLSNCPKCVEDLTLKKETVLHLALNYGQVEVFKELVNWLRRHWQHDLLSFQDQDGNTVLHLAILRRHHEMVELLLHHCNLLVRNAVQVNLKNKDGLTALDLILLELPQGMDQERIERILRGVGAKGGHDIGCQPKVPSMIKWVLNSIVRPVLKCFSFRVDPNTPIKARNALLVVVALIVSATYQTGISPPGGYWQDDYQNKGPDDPKPTHHAGDAILSTTYSGSMYNALMLCNYAGFILSSVLLFNLTTGFPFRGPLLVAQIFMVITYMMSTPIFFTNASVHSELVFNGLMTWIPISVTLIFWFLSRTWIKKIRKRLLLISRCMGGCN